MADLLASKRIARNSSIPAGEAALDLTVTALMSKIGNGAGCLGGQGTTVSVNENGSATACMMGAGDKVKRAPEGSQRTGSVSEALLPVVYQELRRLAAHRLSEEPAGQTLQATALVHEAWLRLVESEPQTWQNRNHFFSAAAEAMRRILIENARRKRRLKRGGSWVRVDWEESALPSASPDDQILLLDEALADLARQDRVEAEVVKLRFFVGLSHSEIAGVLGISERSVKRYWAFAKVWLYRRMREGTEDETRTPTGT